MIFLKKCTLFMFLVGLCSYSYSQEQRITDRNTIGWLAYSGSLKIHPKTALLTEFQWRREDGFKNKQQNLLRTAFSYAVRKDLSLNIGYAFAETYPYGDYPNANAFSEHRVFEQLVLKNPIGKVEVAHRFTLEQRFLEKFSIQNGESNTDWVFLNRLRYRLRVEIPITKSITDNNSWSLALMDEVFVGFGENVGANVFDQNRLATLIGYKVNKNIKIEAGYLSQILQQGKKVNDKSVFQYNNGFMLTTHLSFDAVK